MEFGLGFPCMNLYPPTLQPWEATATSADLLAFAASPAVSSVDAISLSCAKAFDDRVAEAWADSLDLSPRLDLRLRGACVSADGERAPGEEILSGL